MALCITATLLMLSGCETDSFFDPSVVGRWEHTPVTLPILDRLDVIEGEDTESLAVTGVRPEDLIPDMREYVVGAGDLLTVTVFELVALGQESVQTRRVDETGLIRLPIIGPVRAAGLTSSQLEAEIASVLERKNILPDAVVSVILQESRQNTFSVIGEPLQGGTAIGTYVIPKPDFRLLDALALARGVPGRTKRLRVFRQTALTAEVAGEVTEESQVEEAKPAAPAPKNPSKLIDELLEGIDEEPVVKPAKEKPAAPTAIEGGLDAGVGNSPQWVFAGGKWVKVDKPVAGGVTTAELDETSALGDLITQRIVEIPYERLVEGDLRYNIVIRPGDVIKVPDPSAGFVYIMGEIARPGAYQVPGESDLTIKQLIASAGGLSQLAIPERVDLTRRVADAQEATLRINVRAIFEGTEPDLYLKPNDLINVGTNFIATPLAIFRNGFRMTYGFGFVLDRNFGSDVFGPIQ
ncbi:polysaccharide biosynthesis/export family protein [Poriferisphaera sp. WC338]|uniref:polysaccharide biosynthesis/export family protein n=1 Tax=Poriferisphaera sp. WC338 TaxID=3425129 RepID=UPI003D81B0C0